MQKQNLTIVLVALVIISFFIITLRHFHSTSSLQGATMNVTQQFKDKVIFITGGTSGIGLATAVQFANAGAAHVIVCGRSAERWEKAKSYIQSHTSNGKVIEYWPCDVRIESDMKNIIEKIFNQYGRLDVAFNNAGVSPGIQPGGTDMDNMDFTSMLGADGAIEYSLDSPQPTSKNTQDKSWQPKDPTQAQLSSDYRENPMATSIFGVFYSMKWEIATVFKRQPKDLPFAIINTASRNGIIPDPNRPLYAASKAFVIALSKSLSNGVAQRAVKEKRAMIRINVIAPGPVDTPMERSAFPGTDENFIAHAAQGVPMQRVATAEEIAPAVLFLADSQQASYITGAILPVDGGDVASPYIPPIN